MREIGSDPECFVSFMSADFYANGVSNWNSKPYVSTVGHKIICTYSLHNGMCFIEFYTCKSKWLDT